MKHSDSPDQISLSNLLTHASSYDSYVPKDLQILEELRVKTIPETLAQRKKDGDTFLEKAELSNLVDWKLFVPDPFSITLNHLFHPLFATH